MFTDMVTLKTGVSGASEVNAGLPAKNFPWFYAAASAILNELDGD
jgi:hypothetical protein